MGSEDSAAAFSRVYDEYFLLLMKIVYRITGRQDVAEEIVQEAFIKYYERRDVLPTDEGLKFWLIRVVKNLALNYEKRKGREKRAYQRFFFEPKPGGEAEGERKLLEDESKVQVQTALEKIPYNLRVVLILKEYGGFNYNEIAKMLGITEGNVKVRVFRARNQLSSLMGKEGV